LSKRRPIDPITRRRRLELGRELHRLRMLAGLTTRAVAAELGVNQSSISRFEKGELVPNRNQLTAFVGATSAPPGTLDSLIDLAGQAHTTVTPLRAWAGQGAGKQAEIAELEEAAGVILSFQSQVVPGLLQTREYARRTFELSDITGDQDYAAKVEGRMRRQAVLRSRAKRFEFLITEAALLWRAGPDDLMAAQIDHLTRLTNRENVTIGIIQLDPRDAPASMVWVESFDLYLDMPEGARVLVELVAGDVAFTDPETAVAEYQQTYDALRGDAVFADEARGILAGVRREFAG
jgi:transcriptional regulator with XRE-family HTH domain